MIADEPVSALDVSVRSQVLNLMVRLQRERGLTYIFISHDLSVVEHISHTIAIMYLGRIVEKGPAEQVFAKPAHPYTRALIAAVPVPDPDHPRHQTRAAGRRAKPGASAERLPLPHPLPRSRWRAARSRRRCCARSRRGSTVACHLR